MKVNKIIAITTISTIAAAGLANAQTITATDSQKGILQQAMSLFKTGKTDEAKQLLRKHDFRGRSKGMGNRNNDRKAIEDAIISGNFSLFQQVASTSPLKGLTQDTFNKLTPQFQAKKNAEDQIRSILSSAGIQPPQRQ